MIKFTREVVVNREYEVTIKEFMECYYSGAAIANDNGNLLIYVKSALNSHNMSYVFEIPLNGEKVNVYDDEAVGKIIRKAHKNNNIKY